MTDVINTTRKEKKNYYEINVIQFSVISGRVRRHAGTVLLKYVKQISFLSRRVKPKTSQFKELVEAYRDSDSKHRSISLNPCHKPDISWALHQGHHLGQ